MKLLKNYLDEIASAPRDGKRLWAFDFDDTLVVTSAVTRVTSASGRTFELTPGQLALYEGKEGDIFDYSQFERLVSPRLIRWTNRIFHHVKAHHGSDGLVVISARGTREPIEEFLRASNATDVEIVALGTTNPTVKSGWLDERIRSARLGSLEFFDDSHKNVAAVRELGNVHPNVKIISRHIRHRRISSLTNH